MKCKYCMCNRLRTTRTVDGMYATIRYKKCVVCGANYKSIETLCVKEEEKEKENETVDNN